MLGTLLPKNWSQISEEIPSSLVIISHREWDGGEGGSEEKGRGIPDIHNKVSIGLPLHNFNHSTRTFGNLAATLAFIYYSYYSYMIV